MKDMNALPKVSIVMSVFNGEQHLHEAIDSILEQTYSNFEFIIIDDASIDRSKVILDEYAERDERIKLIENEKNLKLAESLNKGIRIAKGKYIARMDADDVSLPMRLSEQVKFMEANQHIAVCGSWVSVYEEPSIVWKTNIAPEAANCAAFFESCFHHPTVLIRKSILDKYGAYNEDIEFAQDCHLWSRLAFEHKAKFANLPKALLRYRSHPERKRDDYRVIQHEKATLLRHKNLERMRVSYSGDDYYWHDVLSSGKPLMCMSQFTFLLKWMYHLEEANKLSDLLDKKSFKQELSQKLLRVCLLSSSNTLAAPIAYIRYCKFRCMFKNIYRVFRMLFLFLTNSRKSVTA